MPASPPIRWLIAGAIAACLAGPGGLAAQSSSASAAAPTTVVLKGHVVDGAGKPVPHLLVTLHRVDAKGGGAAVAHDTTSADGAFQATLTTDGNQAVYFAAAHYKGQLYIGPPLESPLPPSESYVLTVGTPATSGNALIQALNAATGGGQGGATGVASEGPAAVAAQAHKAAVFWTGLIVMVLLALAATVYRRQQMGRVEPAPARAALMRLAAVEEHLAALDASETDARARAEATRNGLLQELRSSARGGPHAAG